MEEMMRKKMMMWFAALSMMMTASIGFAQTRPGFAIGIERLNYGYSEHFEGQTVANDKGGFFGVSTAYTKTFGKKNFFRGTLGIDRGSVDYRADDGTRLDNVDQMFGRLELELGRDFTFRNGTTISPFIGLASRVLDDYSGGRVADNGMKGYDRHVAYRYIPVGAGATFSMRGATTLTISGQYNWVTDGHVKSDFSKLDPEMPDINVPLAGGSGYELSAMFNVPLRSRMLSVGPFVSGWRINQSREVTLTDPAGSGETLLLLEPANRTTKAGLRLTFSF
jgi:hypothetical protein